MECSKSEHCELGQFKCCSEKRIDILPDQIERDHSLQHSSSVLHRKSGTVEDMIQSTGNCGILRDVRSLSQDLVHSMTGLLHERDRALQMRILRKRTNTRCQTNKDLFDILSIPKKCVTQKSILEDEDAEPQMRTNCISKSTTP